MGNLTKLPIATATGLVTKQDMDQIEGKMHVKKKKKKKKCLFNVEFKLKI